MYLYGVCYNQDCLYRSFIETHNFPPKKQLWQEKLLLNRRNFEQDQAPKRGPSCLMASGLKLEKKVQGGRTKKKDLTNLLLFKSQSTNTQRHKKKLACD